MDTDILKTFGQLAGIGGLALGVLLLVFRDIIRKNIFPRLPPPEAYRLLRLITWAVWSVAIVGIVAWVYVAQGSILTGAEKVVEAPLEVTEVRFTKDAELDVFVRNTGDADIIIHDISVTKLKFNDMCVLPMCTTDIKTDCEIHYSYK